MDLVLANDPSGPRGNDVGLLLLAVTVRCRAAHVRRVAKVADPQVTRVKVLATEPALDPGGPIANGVLELQQVHNGEAGHAVSSCRMDSEPPRPTVAPSCERALGAQTARAPA